MHSDYHSSLKSSLFTKLSLGFTTFITLASSASAQEAAAVNSGDTAWMTVASLLVLLMTLPSLALFYGGLLRSKNVLSILVQCFAMAGVMNLLWVIYGYSLAMTDGNAVIGGSGSSNGLTMGAQVWAQTKSILVTVGWSGIAAVIAFTVAKFTVGLRIDERGEEEGLDQQSHGESAYTDL